jgi:hypothetical protein
MEPRKTLDHRRLTDVQRDQFLHEGFVKLENAFSLEIAADARTILWRETGCDPHDPTTWIRAVIRLGDFAQEPFRSAANTPTLHAAFDDLVGVDRWIPRDSLGGFPIRFPHPEDPGDTGWHVDASFAPPHPVDSYLDWRVNLRSKGRALLMLFLFSDIGSKDAPTRVRRGSHLFVPRLLAPAGEDGMSAMELGAAAARVTNKLPETLATGAAGTVYLCHPFLVHAAQPHHGSAPRFMAHPPLYPKVPFDLERRDGNYSLVEQAIRLGLNQQR